MAEHYKSLQLPYSNPDRRRLELMAELLHAVYQAEARRQAEQGVDAVRHEDEYLSLPEHTKDYDRALAIYFMTEWPGSMWDGVTDEDICLAIDRELNGRRVRLDRRG